MKASRLELKAELNRLRSRRDAAASAKLRPRSVLLTAALLGALLAAAYHLGVVRALGGDPWLGAHHRLVCPRVCNACRGPYVIFAWDQSHTAASEMLASTKVYCRASADQFDGYSEAAFLSELDQNAPYELPGATYTLYASSLLLWTLLVVPAVIRLERRRARRLRARVPDLDDQLTELEARLKR